MTNSDLWSARISRRRLMSSAITAAGVAAAATACSSSGYGGKPSSGQSSSAPKVNVGGRVPPYAPLTEQTQDELSSWFNPATDAKWKKNPITVHVSSWWAPEPEISGAEAAFNKFFTPKTGIKVVYEYIGANYDAKVLTRIASGKPYDVVTFNANSVGNYAKKGTLMDLAPFIGRDKYDLSDFYPWAANEFTFDGTRYGLTNDVGGFFLYYNEEKLQEAGVTPPNPTWTWDELLQAAKKLTIRNGSATKQWGVDFSDIQGVNFGDLLARMNGTDLWNHDVTAINLADPKVIRAYQFFYDLIYTHKVAPSPGAFPAGSFDAFAAGKTAVLLDGSWGIDYFRYKEVKAPWNIASLPAGPDAQGPVEPYIFAAGWTIPKGVQDPDASWATMKFYASKTFSDHVMGRILSSLPSRKSELATPSAYDLWPKARPKGLTQKFLTEYMQVARTGPQDRVAFNDKVTASLNKTQLVWSGKTTPQKQFPGLAREINTELSGT